MPLAVLAKFLPLEDRTEDEHLSYPVGQHTAFGQREFFGVADFPPLRAQHMMMASPVNK